MTSTNRDFSNQNIKILSIDFETMQITENNIARNQIFAAGFYSNTGFKEAIHLEDVDINNNEVKFIRHIVYRIQSFPGIITGWYLANSDLVVLDEVCKHIGVRSPVEFYEVLVTPAEDDDFGNTNSDDNDNHASITIEPQVIRYPYLRDKKIIDMYKVFHHGFIKNSVYPFKYRDLHLDTVGTAMLGHGKYVSESTGVKITGENVLQYPVFEQKKYVLRDAELVIRLIERNNYEILNVLRCIAEIAGLDFRQVCHAGVGKAWEAIIYRMIETGQCKRPATEGLKKRRYSGALGT